MATIAKDSYVIVTAGSALFSIDDKGRELWKKYDTVGDGGGRLRIVEYLSTTKVLCRVIDDIEDTAIAASGWCFTVDKVSGLTHLEGETVGLIVDGGTHNDLIVKKGAIRLNQQASRVFVGYKYTGIIETLNLDSGGVTGSAQGKPRNVYRAMINFMNSLGCKFGTTFYNLEKLVFRTAKDFVGRPVPPFNENKDVSFSDNYDNLQKKVFIVQQEPLPCHVRGIDISIDTTDEQY